jgi:nitroreductase
MNTHAIHIQDLPAFENIMKSRRSVRAFLPAVVPKTLLDSVFALANHTPSNCNTQPWLVHVASGNALASLRTELPAALQRGEFSMDFPYDGQYPGVYKERQKGAAVALFAAMDIAREDKVKRNDAFMRNFTFFDAPHAVFLFMPEAFGLREAMDVGMYAQSLMLSLTAHGLASCPQTALGFHAEIVRKVLGIEPQQKLLFGISFGYADDSAPANTCRTERAALADNVIFHG